MLSNRCLVPVIIGLTMLTGCAHGSDHASDSVSEDGKTVELSSSPDARPGRTLKLDTVDAHRDEDLERRGFASLAVAGVDEDGLTSLSASGLRRVGGVTKITQDDRYHIGSNTKAMTATLTAVLVEKGILNWDLTLGEAFELAHPDYREVTVLELLAHRGGMPSVMTVSEEATAILWNKSADVMDSRRDFALNVVSDEPENALGEFNYSNAGYIVVGAILESLTGNSWEDLMVEHLFNPLTMTRCGFGTPATNTSNQPWGHNWTENGLSPVRPSINTDNPPAFGPAGTVHCSLGDWAKFVRAHLIRGEGTRIELSEEGFETLQRPFGLKFGSKYALGWGVSKSHHGQHGNFLSHDGTNLTFYASVILDLDAKVATLIVTNTEVRPGSEQLEDLYDVRDEVFQALRSRSANSKQPKTTGSDFETT